MTAGPYDPSLKRKRKNRKMFNQFLIELHFPFLFLLSFNKKREIKIKKKTIQRKMNKKLLKIISFFFCLFLLYFYFLFSYHFNL